MPLPLRTLPTALLLIVCALAQTPAPTSPPASTPPPGWKGPVFQLSNQYPHPGLTAEHYPWLDIDFRTRGLDYARAVLRYLYDGNVGPGIPPDREFVQSAGKSRRWYNSPWLKREFVHGLTQERTAGCQQLAPGQSQRAFSWGVGFSNAAAASAIGTLWAFNGSANPDRFFPARGVYPEGAVNTKLIFTEATVAEVPYLAGSREWQANLPVVPASALACNGSFTPNSQTTYEIRTVRLLQIDIAVKDPRSLETGWVFGTFVYSSSAPGTTPWEKMIPVGISWGNDPAVPEGGTLKQAVFNPQLPIPKPAGMGGRLNGMVDSPSSSCILCHEGAEYPVGPPKKSDPYANFKSPRPYTAGSLSLDYSLSAVDAIDICQASKPCSQALNPGQTPLVPSGRQQYTINRDGKVLNPNP